MWRVIRCLGIYWKMWYKESYSAHAVFTDLNVITLTSWFVVSVWKQPQANVFVEGGVQKCTYNKSL